MIVTNDKLEMFFKGKITSHLKKINLNLSFLANKMNLHPNFSETMKFKSTYKGLSIKKKTKRKNPKINQMADRK